MISRPEQDGDQQLRMLGDAWDQAAEHWRDGPARQFGDSRLAPLLQEPRTYLEALRKLMDTLEAADRETEINLAQWHWRLSWPANLRQAAGGKRSTAPESSLVSRTSTRSEAATSTQSACEPDKPDLRHVGSVISYLAPDLHEQIH